MSKPYYPANDEQYKVWLANFVTQLSGNLAQVGLVAADLDPLSGAFDEFDAALSTHNNAKVAAKAAVNAKFTKRDASEDLLKPLVRRITNHPGMTDALRGILGLQKEHTAAASIPVTEMRPLVLLESNPGGVAVHWGPNPENEGHNGKPEGVKSANIYRRKAGEETYQLIVNVTKSPYIDTIVGDGSDYTYVVRYKGTGPGDLSYQSEAAMVAARGEEAA